MDDHPKSALWYVSGTAVLLAEGIRDLRRANTSHFPGWAYVVAAVFLAFAALGAWRQTRPSRISTTLPNEREADVWLPPHGS
jgi:hypothetical protein